MSETGLIRQSKFRLEQENPRGGSPIFVSDLRYKSSSGVTTRMHYGAEVGIGATKIVWYEPEQGDPIPIRVKHQVRRFHFEIAIMHDVPPSYDDINSARWQPILKELNEIKQRIHGVNQDALRSVLGEGVPSVSICHRLTDDTLENGGTGEVRSRVLFGHVADSDIYFERRSNIRQGVYRVPITLTVEAAGYIQTDGDETTHSESQHAGKYVEVFPPPNDLDAEIVIRYDLSGIIDVLPRGMVVGAWGALETVILSRVTEYDNLTNFTGLYLSTQSFKNYQVKNLAANAHVTFSTTAPSNVLAFQAANTNYDGLYIIQIPITEEEHQSLCSEPRRVIFEGYGDAQAFLNSNGLTYDPISEVVTLSQTDTSGFLRNGTKFVYNDLGLVTFQNHRLDATLSIEKRVLYLGVRGVGLSTKEVGYLHIYFLPAGDNQFMVIRPRGVGNPTGVTGESKIYIDGPQRAVYDDAGRPLHATGNLYQVPAGVKSRIYVFWLNEYNQRHGTAGAIATTTVYPRTTSVGNLLPSDTPPPMMS